MSLWQIKQDERLTILDTGMVMETSWSDSAKRGFSIYIMIKDSPSSTYFLHFLTHKALKVSKLIVPFSLAA